MNGFAMFFALAAAAALPIQGQNTDTPRRKPDVVLRWNEATLEAIKSDHTPPPLAARNLAIVHAALFDAINTIGKTYQAFRADQTAEPTTSAEVAGAVAAHRTLVALYPKQAQRFDELLQACLEETVAGAAKTNGAALGVKVADTILAWRAEDGASRKVAYTPGKAPGIWRPTPPDLLPALLPHWSSVTPFAIPSAAKFRPAAPPALDSEEYAAAFKEVKALGDRRSTTRKVEQTLIAWFWADDAGTVTPPGHWNRIAQTIAREKRLTLMDNARLFALLNAALADAAICCWDCKFRHNYWRPVTAIRAAPLTPPSPLGGEGGVRGNGDPDWLPLILTPPFPSYVSGHSTFSAAAATVLADFFGRDEIAFATDSDGLPGVKRSFTKFSAAADEAGRSRIYGGIHWEFDNREGLALGRAIGRHVTRTLLLPRTERPEKSALPNPSRMDR
jgi:membrane-associated phospholipid phosphatase